ncbi:MAG: ATP-binding protein [Blautia sp.]|nr:ATP-binding protein [Blautia sp.]
MDSLRKIAGSIPESDNAQEEFLDPDGFRCCGVCGKRRENEYSMMGKTLRVRCMCDCEQEEYRKLVDEQRKKEFEMQVHALKSVGLTERRFLEWCFSNDNGKNPKMDLAKSYVSRWPSMKEKNIGYLIWGNVGTGKSFFAGCIANALMEQGIGVMMTNFSRILNELNSRFEGKNEWIGHLVSYPLLIIDDLGIERNSAYAMEMIYNIIDRRYCSKLPLIVTTNLTYQEMTAPDLDLEHQRIYSRLFEMCIPICFDGEDMRAVEHREKKEELMQLLRPG